MAKFQNKYRFLILTLIISASLSAETLENQNNKIFIEANKVEIIEDKNSTEQLQSPNKIVLTGNVEIKHQDTVLNADKIIIEKKADDERDLIASANKNNIVIFTQKTINPKTRQNTTTICKAKQITYNTKTRDALLNGEAYLQNDQNLIQADQITYNANSGEYHADKGKSKQRVKIVISPN